MNQDVYMIIKKYAEMLNSVGYSMGEGLQILMKGNGYCYATEPGADFSNLKEEDIVEYVSGKGFTRSIEAEFLMGQSEAQALVISNTPYCKKCREMEKEIEATLDDMAQIVGQKVSIAQYTPKSVKNALKHSEGCFVRDNYTITIGRTLYEAVVALTVLEKSAEVCLKAEKIGGGQTIPKVEAKLMRMIYKKKYSKSEEKVKASEVKGL